jgi:hypothetical protein
VPVAQQRQPRAAGDPSLEFRLGRHELIIRRRYEAASIINDLMIGVWFAVGSLLFFSPGTVRAGTVLFLLGSLQLLIRPTIRLLRNLHVQRINPVAPGFLTGSSHDF